MKTNSFLRATLLAAWKDLQVILRDRGLLMVIIGLPLIMSMLNGVVNTSMSSADGEESLTFPVVLVNLDEDGYGGQIASILDQVEILKVTELATESEARQQVLDSKFLAAIIIPADLTEKVNAYQPSEILVVIDPTQEQIASTITGIMKEVVTPVVLQGEISYGIRTLLAEIPLYQQADDTLKRAFEAQSMAVNMAQLGKIQSNPWVKVQAKTTSGEDLVIVPENLFVLIVPSFTVLFVFFIVGAMSSELLRERREGSLRRLIAAPIPRAAIIAGKMLAYLGLVLIQVMILLGVANLIFGMPLGNSLAGLILLTIAMGLSATGLGMLVAALSKSDRQADSIGVLLGFVLGGLGGCFVIGTPVPLYKSGGAMEFISRLTPHAHALLGFDLLLNGKAGVLEILPEVGILMGFAAFFFLIAVWRFRFEEK